MLAKQDSANPSPLFTVAIATYQRGAKIQSTLESVAGQSLDDFEVLVVSDGPPHHELAETVAAFGTKFRLLELPERVGSQAGPNNFARDAARGQYLAYLGHDDVWHPDHLEALAAVFSMSPDVDFAISGTLLIGPAGAVDELTWVTGIFSDEEPSPGFNHFFPPSSVAHRTSPHIPIGAWPDASSSRAPVDSAFLKRAAESGSVFGSTGRITVYKFNSALRYLSYLQPEDREQRKILELFSVPAALDRFTDERVELTKRQGTYMFLRHPDPAKYQPGEIPRGYERIRGIKTADLREVTSAVEMRIDDENRGFDWHPVEHDSGGSWIWSGPSTHPRLALPFTTSTPVRVIFHVAAFISAEVKESLRIFANGDEVAHTVEESAPNGSCAVAITVNLRETQPTVIGFQMNQTVAPSKLNPSSPDHRQLGMCLTRVTLEPA